MKIWSKPHKLTTPQLKPWLKPAAVALALSATYGLGKCEGENQGEKRLELENQKFAGKEQLYTRQIDSLNKKLSSFRFYEIDESGHRVAEIEEIRNRKMPETMQNRFKKYQMREICPEEIMRLDTLMEAQGIDWKTHDTNPELLKELGARLTDSLNIQPDESYLHEAFSYRQLMLEEMCRLSRVAKLRHDFSPFRMSDEDLQLEIKFRPALIKTKLKANAYKNLFAYQREANRLELIRKIVEMRQVVDKNNQIVRALQYADKLAFENEKKDQIQKLRQMPPKSINNPDALVQKFAAGEGWGK